jgi:carnitine-CoA ligase
MPHPADLTVIDSFYRAMAMGEHGRPFIYFEGNTYSYSQIARMCAHAADQLKDQGFQHGDRIVTILPTTPQSLALHLAIGAMGCIYVPLKPDSRPAEFDYFITNSDPAGIIVDNDVSSDLTELLRRFDRVLTCGDPEPRVQVNRGSRSLDLTPEGRGDEHMTPASTPEDELSVIYTSGSTGRPKGIRLRQKSCVAVGVLGVHRLGLEASDVILGVLPQHYFGGIKMLSHALACGGGLMMERRFSRTRFWADVAYAGATAGILMPAMMSMLLTNPRDEADRDNSLRTVIAHLVNHEFEDRFGVEIATTWGQSELAGIGTLSGPRERSQTPGFVGSPVSEAVQIEIRDDSGKTVDVGQTGEIYCRHPWIFKGYLNAEADTANTIKEGWIVTGDRGHVDGDGQLYYDGRKKNMIKRSGENISGAEIERVLEQHPAVSECAAFGVPDPVRTEELKVVVTLRPGAAASEEDLAAWCAEHLAAFKVPRFVEIRETLPRLTSLKIDRVRLREAHDKQPGWDREVPERR